MKRALKSNAYTRDAGSIGENCQYKVGDKITFVMSCLADGINRCYMPVERVMHGTVMYVNEEHQYYTAQTECNGYKICESFKY